MDAWQAMMEAMDRAAFAQGMVFQCDIAYECEPLHVVQNGTVGYVRGIERLRVQIREYPFDMPLASREVEFTSGDEEELLAIFRRMLFTYQKGGTLADFRWPRWRSMQRLMSELKLGGLPWRT